MKRITIIALSLLVLASLVLASCSGAQEYEREGEAEGQSQGQAGAASGSADSEGSIETSDSSTGDGEIDYEVTNRVPGQSATLEINDDEMQGTLDIAIGECTTGTVVVDGSTSVQDVVMHNGQEMCHSRTETAEMVIDQYNTVDLSYQETIAYDLQGNFLSRIVRDNGQVTMYDANGDPINFG